MIDAAIDANSRTGTLVGLQAHAARLGHQRAEYLAQALAQALRNASHRWRSPAALWPELGLE